MAADVISPSQIKIVDTTLNHWLDPKLGGHKSFHAGTSEYYRRKFDVKPVKIQDIRGREDEFSLDTQGFQFYQSPTVGGDFTDSDRVKREVYPETEELLKKATGATRVVVFSHILRNDDRDAADKRVADDPSLVDDTAEVKDVAPARFIHVDQSYEGAIEVLDDNVHPPELAKQLKKSRWAIINVWRPIKPVLKDPLGFCDDRTVREEDLIPVPAYFPAKSTGHRFAGLTKGAKFELFYLKYHLEQRWYYRERMEPGECLFIKCFDTIQDGKTARRTPHSAFIDPSSKESKSRRESVEIRCLVFFEDQPV